MYVRSMAVSLNSNRLTGPILSRNRFDFLAGQLKKVRFRGTYHVSKNLGIHYPKDSELGRRDTAQLRALLLDCAGCSLVVKWRLDS